MTTDVLLYNAIKSNLAITTTANATAALANATASGTAAGTAAGNAAYTTGSTCFLTNQIGFGNITEPVTWRNIPRMTAPTGGVIVCDASGYYRCGASCSWTVPVGITCAEFMLWGPGGGSGTNCCCGGAPFAPSGAFALVAKPVIAGEVYVLCAGCAYCCYATQTTPGMQGSPSYVTGTGFTGFCAEGGRPCVCEWRASLPGPGGNPGWGLTFPGGSSCQFPSGNNCGPESCSGWSFCWDGVADSMTVQDFSFSCTTKFYGTATGGTIYGLAGMYPKIVLSESLCGTTTAPPVFGFDNTTQCTYCWNGSTCAGCNFGWLTGGIPRLGNPGSGGYASSVYGGCNACYGDSGRMGMVCVRYK